MFFSCTSFFEKNIYLLNEKFERLQRDSFFIIAIDKNKVIHFEDSEIESYEQKFQEISLNRESNLYCIYSVKNGNLEEAEKIWFELLKKEKFKVIFFLNLLRTFYILEDWEGSKKLFENLHLEQKLSFKEAKVILDVLESQKRFEELLLYLDFLTNNLDLEIPERILSGNYYLSYGEKKQAEAEFEKVLSVYSFQKEGLEGMLKVYFYEENYETAEIFLKSFLQFYKPNEEIALIGAEIFYKLGKHEEGMNLLKQITPQDKKKFFSLWKALSYSLNYRNIKPVSQFLKFSYPYKIEQEAKIFQKILLSE